MTNKNILKYLVGFLVAFVSFPIYASHDIVKELDSGNAVVLIINADEKSESEQYADWSDYLNQFSAEVGKQYVFHKVSSAQLDKLISNAEKYNKSYSMIFLKKGKPAYFYKGPILEPQVYKYVQLSYSGKPIEPKYLLQFSPEEINIKFKTCK